MLALSFTMLTLGVVAGLALLLGAVGLYGVLSYRGRRADAGDRRADGPGATAGAVRRMVVAQGARVVLVGATIGIIVALASTGPRKSALRGETGGPDRVRGDVGDDGRDRRARELHPGAAREPGGPDRIAARRPDLLPWVMRTILLGVPCTTPRTPGRQER